MKALFHVCLSNHPHQLERWRQAFPDGQMIAGLADIADAGAGTILWVHTDVAKEKPLEQILTDTKQRLSNLRVVVISSTPSSDESLRAISAGAHGYCHAQSTPALFHQVATVVDNDGLWPGADLMDRLLAAAARVFTSSPDHAVLSKLSAREKDVALAVASGQSNREIALGLDITERTVKAHLSAIFTKLEVRDRLQLVVLLRRNQ